MRHHTGRICALLILPAALAVWQPSSAANAFPQIAPSLALIGALDENGKLSSLGTAFCVSAANGASYFITNNHVVTDEKDRPETALVAILAADMHDPHPARHKATIVRRSDDPDLAVVEVQGVHVAPVHVSTSFPQVGDDVAIAGFPYNESVLWGRLFGGRGFRMDRSFPPELEPSYHRGPVSAIHGGGYYIQYDALTDNGNSGGPLFDPSTGEVYGVVQASVEGAPEYRGVPSSIHNNLAISIRQGWDFIARGPVTIDPQTLAAASAEHFVRGNARCGHLSGQRAHAQAEISYLQTQMRNPENTGRRAQMSRAIASYTAVLKKLSHKRCR